MALAAHLRIAQTDGPKAGFNAYVKTLERSGLEQTQEALAELRSAGNAKKQFDYYCAKFGKHFGTTPVKSDELAELQEKIAELTARANALAETPVVEKPKRSRLGRRSSATTTANVAGKENLWRPWAIKKYGIPEKVGATFTYKSKRANKVTTHEVVRITEDGVYCKRVK